jgi:hypothetical protein
MKKLSTAWGFVLTWGFFALVILLLLQVKSLTEYPIVRARLERIEAFQNAIADGLAKPSTAGTNFVPRPETAGNDVSPGDPGLNKPRVQFNLLADWLPGFAAMPSPKELQPEDILDGATSPVLANGKLADGLNAQHCYEGDFQTRLERTGNYRQLTNNYKRGDPNSCTAPLQNLVLPFYKIEPLPYSGCLAKGEGAL